MEGPGPPEKSRGEGIGPQLPPGWRPKSTSEDELEEPGQATLGPRIIEVGAGGGYLAAMIFEQNRLAISNLDQIMLVTDFLREPGERGTLLAAAREGLPVQYGVDANRLYLHIDFPVEDDEDDFELVDLIYSAQCYGEGPSKPGMSYGLRRYTGKFRDTSSEEKAAKRKRIKRARKLKQQDGESTPETEIDERFLGQAWLMLKVGGCVVMLARSNLLFYYLQRQVLHSRSCPYDVRWLARHNAAACGQTQDAHYLYTHNLFADASIEDLHYLAKFGFRITFCGVQPPQGLRTTAHGDHREHEERVLSSFNVQIVFEKIPLHDGETPPEPTYEERQPFWTELRRYLRD